MNKSSMLLALIEHYSDGNKARFSKLLGVSPQTISAWITRNTFDSEVIYTKCRYVSPDWLLSGEGSMLRSEEAACDAEKENQEKKGIPLIPLSAMAGAMTSERTVLEYECERYVVPAFSGADFLIPVKGDSMMPTYQSGDLIACKRVPLGDLFFQWNKAYVLDTKQGPLVKRIKPGSDDMHVMIVSDNKTYDPFELPRSAINSVAMVMGIIRLE